MLAYDWNFLGLSLEAKPMSGEKVVDGSTFYECDTCDFYIFYQNKWYKQTLVTEDGINVCLYKSLMKKMFGKLFDGNITKGKLIKPDTGTNIEFTTNLPAQIIDLTGYGDSTQQTYTGKNLLYIPTGTSASNGITWTRNGNTVSGTGTGTGSYSATSGWLSYTLPAGTYTFSIGEAVTKRVQFARRVDSSSPAQTVNLPAGDTSITFTSAEATSEYHVVLLDTSGETLTDYTIKDIQLEAGSEASSFEPYVGGIPAPNPEYPQDIHVVTGEQTVMVSDGTNSQSYTIDLGTTELCKIGDYQDYIYKNGDDWYVHKEIGKYTFNGSEGWGEQSNYNTDNRMFFGFNATNVIAGDNIAGRTGISNNFIFVPIQSPSIDVTGFYFHQSANYSKWIYVKIQRSLLPTENVTGFKNWLANNNMIVYYQKTPTDTQITDATLVGQLNALLNYTFPAGVNNIIITADDLPMPLKLIISEKE